MKNSNESITPHLSCLNHLLTSILRMSPLIRGYVVGAYPSPGFHSKSPPTPHPPPHQKPLKTPCKNQKSRTPSARPTLASTPVPALRIRYRTGSWSALVDTPFLCLFYPVCGDELYLGH